MKIVLTVPLEESIPPRTYGGTELIVSLLAQEYTRAGHQVFVLGTGDSHSEATIIPIIPHAIRNMEYGNLISSWREYWKYTGASHIIAAIRDIKPDIVHNHFAWRLVAFEEHISCPMMSTMHGPLVDAKERTTYRAHRKHPYISISRSQQKALPDINWAGVVHNGIDSTRYHYDPSDQRDYFVFVGRTSPEKGLAEIIQLIRQTPYTLKIAAKVDAVDAYYFATSVEPYIDNDQIQFVGEVGIEEKNELLRHARALVLWLNWEEPFGLVVPEANACGTPVIVNRRGSMPELVQNGKNGLLVDTLEQFRAALDQVTQLDGAACRAHVLHNFTSTEMAKKYLQLATRIISDT